MKSIVNIYQKIFMQVWIFVLSTLVFVSGILLLTDLNNYRYVITEGFGATYSSWLDEQGTPYARVYIKCETKLVYFRHPKQFEYTGYNEVKLTSDYRVKEAQLYLDIYETKNGEQVFLETIQSSEYSKDFYDLEYAHGIKIVPRLENVKYEYPSWRIYVPVLIFVLTLPIILLSGYLIVIMIIEKVKFKIKSETPIPDQMI